MHDINTTKCINILLINSINSVSVHDIFQKFLFRIIFLYTSTFIVIILTKIIISHKLEIFFQVKP